MTQKGIQCAEKKSYGYRANYNDDDDENNNNNNNNNNNGCSRWTSRSFVSSRIGSPLTPRPAKRLAMSCIYQFGYVGDSRESHMV